MALKEFEHGGGLAAGHDEAVDAFKVGWEADELRCCAEGAERFGVGFVCALEGEDTYGEWLGGHRTDTRRVGRQDETECRTGLCELRHFSFSIETEERWEASAMQGGDLMLAVSRSWWPLVRRSSFPVNEWAGILHIRRQEN